LEFGPVLRRPIETTRITGHLGPSTNFSGNGVNQELAGEEDTNDILCTVGDAKTKAMTNPARTNYRFLWGYFVAFFICWVTQAIFWRISGHRGSFLAFVLLRFEEFLRVNAERVFGRQLIPYPPPAFAGSVIGAALLFALPLAGVIWLATAEDRVLRWLGFIALALLALMTFYWPYVPKDIF
jgi:hypothetical protein